MDDEMKKQLMEYWYATCSCKEGEARACFLEVVVGVEGLRVFRFEDVVDEKEWAEDSVVNSSLGPACLQGDVVVAHLCRSTVAN